MRIHLLKTIVVFILSFFLMSSVSMAQEKSKKTKHTEKCIKKSETKCQKDCKYNEV